MRSLSHLDYQAVFLGFLAGYSVPILFACFMPVAAWMLCFWFLAPLVAGYVAARLAAKVPLMHGLAVSVFGLVIFGLTFSSRPLSSWVIWIWLNAGLSLMGAWLWRRYHRRIA